MLYLLRRGTPQTIQITDLTDWRPPPDTVWIDLVSPTRDEELAVERALDVDLPTREEMAAIEPSSRLYQENGATFMTATLLAHSHGERPLATPATFVLAGGLLVTVRYQPLRAFSVFAERATGARGPEDGAEALLGLLEAVVQRLAEILEETERGVEAASGAVFHRPKGGSFGPLLSELARSQSVISVARAAFVSLGRLVSFASLAKEIGQVEARRARLASLRRDVQSLTEHASYESSHIAFLLDAALGLINIEQNGIIKFFSVVAVAFLPPTLVASIYGMNFEHMPELDWPLGYPFALALMALSAIVPLLWFRRRGWL